MPAENRNRTASMQIHKATIHWENSAPDGGKGSYRTAHTWTFDGGAAVPASASDHVMDPPRSSPENVDPEEALVAAVSSCHMLFFLFFADRAGFPVREYRDEAEGVLEPNDEGKLAITVVRLNPQIRYVNATPDGDTAAALHEKSHDHCFIANSLKTRVTVQPADQDADDT